MGIITPKLLKINHLKNLRIKYAQNPKNPENKNGFSWLEEKYQQLLQLPALELILTKCTALSNSDRKFSRLKISSQAHENCGIKKKWKAWG